MERRVMDGEFQGLRHVHRRDEGLHRPAGGVRQALRQEDQREAVGEPQLDHAPAPLHQAGGLEGGFHCIRIYGIFNLLMDLDGRAGNAGGTTRLRSLDRVGDRVCAAFEEHQEHLYHVVPLG